MKIFKFKINAPIKSFRLTWVSSPGRLAVRDYTEKDKPAYSSTVPENKKIQCLTPLQGLAPESYFDLPLEWTYIDIRTNDHGINLFRPCDQNKSGKLEVCKLTRPTSNLKSWRNPLRNMIHDVIHAICLIFARTCDSLIFVFDSRTGVRKHCIILSMKDQYLLEETPLVTMIFVLSLDYFCRFTGMFI